MTDSYFESYGNVGPYADVRFEWRTLTQWKKFADKVRDGFDLCPHCKELVPKLYKIPSRYFKPMVPFWAYGCEYCIAKYAQDRRQRQAKKHMICDQCQAEYSHAENEVWQYAQMVSVFGVDAVQKMQKRKNAWSGYEHNYDPPNLCPSCVENLIDKRRRIRTEAKRVASQNARTRKLGLVSDLTIEQWLRILDLYGWRCRYCGNAFSDLDHVVPVAFGGGTTAKNVVPSCRTCNLSSFRRFRVSLLLQLEDRRSSKYFRV